MARRGRSRRLVACAGASAFLVTGCFSTGGQASSVSAEQLRGGSLAEEVDLDGAAFTVGSKEFTEQRILGSITLHALRASGARVKDQTGLSGSNIVRQALEGGEVDMYWEYSGTGWSQFLQEDEPVDDAQKQFRETARGDARENGIEWLGPARFGNQYAIARASEASGPLADVEKLSDLRDFGERNPDDLTLCGASEFLDREITGIQKTYDVAFPPPQVFQNALALNYVNVAKGSPCQFAEVFTTDARIKSLDLQVLKDDRTHFTSELAALTVRQETLRSHPELEELGELLGDELTEEAMIDLNAMVDLDGRTHDEAALHFLRTNGFIGK